MKRIVMFLFAIGLFTVCNSIYAVNNKQIHEEARFLADKIAHQFGLDKDQLTDAYEINYDFLSAVYPLADKLIAGDEKAITQYYILLDMRNTDLVWIMDNKLYSNFTDIEELFRPIYIKDGKLSLRVYNTYKKSKFFEGKPRKYGSYKGDHSRAKQESNSFYRGKYRHIVYGGQPRLLHDRNKEKLNWARKADFGK